VPTTLIKIFGDEITAKRAAQMLLFSISSYAVLVDVTADTPRTAHLFFAYNLKINLFEPSS
jgi:hypothetical protein